MRTEELIHQLAGHSAPTRRLAPPWQRAAIWFAISAVSAAIVVYFQSVGFSHWQMDARFTIEQIATLATVVTAAIAAFGSVVPGYDRKILILPLAPLLVWIAALGEGCVHDWLLIGSAGLTVSWDYDCMPIAAMIGIVPAIAIIAMLRRGAPLVPHVTLALAALAVAALSNFATRMHHYGDISIMILVWHVGSVFLVALIASLLGRHVLKWPRIAPK